MRQCPLEERQGRDRLLALALGLGRDLRQELRPGAQFLPLRRRGVVVPTLAVDRLGFVPSGVVARPVHPVDLDFDGRRLRLDHPLPPVVHQQRLGVGCGGLRLSEHRRHRLCISRFLPADDLAGQRQQQVVAIVPVGR